MESETLKNGVDQMSAEERKVYDRQIRLWGYAGQNKYEVLIRGIMCYFVFNSMYFVLRLRTTKVLLIGMQGLGAEIAKNLILSCIHSITLKDHTDVSILDRCSQFLIPLDSTERNVCVIFTEDNSNIEETNKILFSICYIFQTMLSFNS